MTKSPIFDVKEKVKKLNKMLVSKDPRIRTEARKIRKVLVGR